MIAIAYQYPTMAVIIMGFANQATGRLLIIVIMIVHVLQALYGMKMLVSLLHIAVTAR